MQDHRPTPLAELAGPNVIEPNSLSSLNPPKDNWRTTSLCHGFVCTWIETFFGPCRANPGHLLARSRPWKLLPCRPCSFESPTRTDPLASVQRSFPNPSPEARAVR